MSRKFLSVHILLKIFKRNFNDFSSSFLKNSWISSGPTAELCDFFMESFNSFSINKLLYSSRFFDLKFSLCFSASSLIVINSF